MINCRASQRLGEKRHVDEVCILLVAVSSCYGILNKKRPYMRGQVFSLFNFKCKGSKGGGEEGGALASICCIFRVAEHNKVIITFPSLAKDESNPLLKCQSVIDVNIFVRLLSSNSSIEMIFICLENLHVMSFLPPPGGPIAVTSS